MKLKNFYDLAVKIGISRDPRNNKTIEQVLKNSGKEYRKLKGAEKSCFDLDSLKNPYPDTRILNGSLETEVKNILLGVDIEAPEVLLFDRLKDTHDLDLLVSHHPEGFAFAGLHGVMAMQADILGKFGLDLEIAKKFLAERMKEVERRIMPANHTRAVDAAKLLNVPFMCMHTVADNCVVSFLQKLFDKKKPKTLNEIINILKSIPEYKNACINKAGPKIVSGKAKDKAGKIFVDMTGGTEGPKDIFGRLSQAGVKTIICMHLSEEHLKNIQKEQINAIIAGHIASDNLGLNLLLDEIEKIEEFNVLSCSGFKRIRHNGTRHRL